MTWRELIRMIACITVIAIAVRCSSQVVSNEARSAPGASAIRSLPFGPKQLPSTLFGRSPFTGAYVNAGTADTLVQRLFLARKANMHLLLLLTGSHTVQNQDGTFSLELWKQHIDRLRGVDLASYVADGTVIGAELVNEPHNKGKWGGRIISKQELEAAAAYSKSIWPSLPVGAGRSDYVLKYAPWEHLDFGHSQYHMRKGDIESWRTTTVQQSKSAGLALLLSLNFYGGEIGNSPMTPQELQRYGSALAADTYACGLTGYMYDEKYFSEVGIAEAFTAIESVAATHPAPPCYVGRVKP